MISEHTRIIYLITVAFGINVRVGGVNGLNFFSSYTKSLIELSSSFFLIGFYNVIIILCDFADIASAFGCGNGFFQLISPNELILFSFKAIAQSNSSFSSCLCPCFLHLALFYSFSWSPTISYRFVLIFFILAILGGGNESVEYLDIIDEVLRSAVFYYVASTYSTPECSASIMLSSTLLLWFFKCFILLANTSSSILLLPFGPNFSLHWKNAIACLYLQASTNLKIHKSMTSSLMYSSFFEKL